MKKNSLNTKNIIYFHFTILKKRATYKPKKKKLRFKYVKTYRFPSQLQDVELYKKLFSHYKTPVPKEWIFKIYINLKVYIRRTVNKLVSNNKGIKCHKKLEMLNIIQIS